MKRRVIIGEPAQHELWLNHILVDIFPDPRVAEEVGRLDDCDEVLVINDGSDAGITAIKSVLELRERRPTLRVAVVTTLQAKWSDTECLARSVPDLSHIDPNRFYIAESGLRHLMTSLDARVEVTIEDHAINFEYHG